MDLELLGTTLSDLGEPAYRERQVWRWAAQGAAGFDAMTDLPLGLRAALDDAVPFSSLTLEQEARASDGTIKALFDDRRRAAGGGGADALPRTGGARCASPRSRAAR